ncbi:hypothetical protein JCM10908_000563 [Rhodotorula pacifica]|uniref:uncharacterized protein n=1 Tax=Rhodotorula pacifica TaxID=1495444 RepID=UPI00317FEF09
MEQSPEIDSGAEDDVPLTATGRPYKKPSIVACTGCRSIKVKCRLLNGEAPSGLWDKDQSKCARCVRLGIDCVYKSAPRRGRRPKERPKSRRNPGSDMSDTRTSAHSSTSAPDPTNACAIAGPSDQMRAVRSNLSPSSTFHSGISAILSDPSAPVPRSADDSGSLFPPSTQPPPDIPLQPPVWPVTSSAPWAGLLPTNAAAASVTTRSSTSAPPAPAHSSPALSARVHPSPASVTSLDVGVHKSMSLADAAQARTSAFLEPTKPIEVQRPDKAQRLPDPVDVWILSEAEAQNLFNLWHERLNPYVILLDHRLHTFEYVRTTSSILFTAMLATSAKFFRRDLYERLLAHAQTMVTRAMGGDVEPDTGLIQAVLTLVYWKAPQDKQAWTRIGYAIRLGYQLGVHHRRTTPLPSDEYEARVLLDRERTWIALICFDNSYTLADGDPEVETRMITSYNLDIDAWLRETLRFDVQDDIEQGVSVGILRVGRLCRAVATARSKSAAQAVAHQAHHLILSVYRKYIEGTLPGFTPLKGAASHKARFHIVECRFNLASACLAASGMHDEAVLADAVQRAGELAECFEEAASSILLYVQDTTALSMLGFGEWIGRIFQHVSTAYQTTLVRYLTQVYLAASRAQREQGAEAGGFIARFFRGALRALHPESVPLTRPGSPNAAMRSNLDMGTANVVPPMIAGPFDQLGVLEEEIFTDLDLLFADLKNDTAYWDSLNPTLTTSTWAWLDEAFAPQDGGMPP